MRFPKRGFRNPTRVEYAVVNIDDLDAHFSAQDEVTPEALVARGLVKDLRCGIKVLGRGELTKALVVKAHRFSRAARDKILAAGGQAEEV
jgi:large subunit ribosomal protein L15